MLLDIKSLLQLSSVCSRFRAVMSDSWLWRRLFHRDFSGETAAGGRRPGTRSRRVLALTKTFLRVVSELSLVRSTDVDWKQVRAAPAADQL